MAKFAPDGELVVPISFSDTVDFGAATLTARGSIDLAIIRIRDEA